MRRRAALAVLTATAASLHLRVGDLAEVKPNEFTEVGCFEPSAVVGKVQYSGGRDITPETCFAYCQSVAGAEDPLLAVQHRTRYFAIEGGSKSCWCSSGYDGSNATGCEECARPAGGALFTEAAHCGRAGAASVYLMHFCAQTTADLDAAKNESTLKAAAADQANRKIFQVLRESQSCSTVHKIKAGKPKAETLVGSLDECKLACGAEVNCAMFTYDTDMSRCLFTDSLGVGATAGGNETSKTCWGKIFGKGPVTIDELANPPPDVPETAAKEMMAAAAGFGGSGP